MDSLPAVCGDNISGDHVPTCPICGKPGQKMRPETISSLVKEELLPSVREGFSLCLDKDCNVVYFGNRIYYKPDVKVKVWFKEENDPSVPVCYCQDVAQGEIYNHVALQKCCQDLKAIQEHTAANTGQDCLTKNPAGT